MAQFIQACSMCVMTVHKFAVNFYQNPNEIIFTYITKASISLPTLTEN